MRAMKEKLSNILIFVFSFLIALSISVESAQLPGAWYHPGRWITRATVPGDLDFTALIPPLAGGNQLAVIRQGENQEPIRYISGFFSVRAGFRAVVDTLVGWENFSQDDLDLVKQVRSGVAAVADLPAARIAVAHFIAAVTHYLNICNATGIPATTIPADLADLNTVNLIRLRNEIVNRIVNSIGKQKGDSEMALMVDIIRNVYADSRLIVRSKMDMCSRCETGLDSTGATRPNRPATDVIPYEIFVGGGLLYASDPHPNGNQDAGYMSTRVAPRHGVASVLFKVALEGGESPEAMPYP